MRKLIVSLAALAALTSAPTHADVYVAAGYDVRMRDQSYDVALGWLHRSGLGVEVAFENMGEQAPGFPNLNKFLSVSAIGYTKFSDRLYGYGKFGVHTSKFSHNGTNSYDREGDSLIGYQAAVGLETPLYRDTVKLYGQFAVYEYRQVNNPNMGGFHKPSVGLRVLF